MSLSFCCGASWYLYFLVWLLFTVLIVFLNIPPAFKDQYLVIPNVQFNDKLTCVKQQPTVKAQFTLCTNRLHKTSSKCMSLLGLFLCKQVFIMNVLHFSKSDLSGHFIICWQCLILCELVCTIPVPVGFVTLRLHYECRKNNSRFPTASNQGNPGSAIQDFNVLKTKEVHVHFRLLFCFVFAYSNAFKCACIHNVLE